MVAGQSSNGAGSARRIWRPVGFLVALVVSVAVALFSLLRWQAARGPEAGLLSVPPAQIVEVGACGFDNLLADAFYVRFSTYWGFWLTHGRKFHNLYPLLDLVTDLDPNFHSAYEVGSLALSDEGQVDRAVELLDKGASRHPADYWYPYQAGLMLFLYSNHWVRAARYFGIAAAKPGADPSAAYFEARMFDVAHRKTDAIDEWITIYLSGHKDMAKVATHSLEKLFHIKSVWIDLYLSDNALAHRLAGRALLRAGVDLHFLDQTARTVALGSNR